MSRNHCCVYAKLAYEVENQHRNIFQSSFNVYMWHRDEINSTRKTPVSRMKFFGKFRLTFTWPKESFWSRKILEFNITQLATTTKTTNIYC